MPSGVDMPVAWNTHVAVASADAAAEAVIKAGGSVVAGPFDAPPAGRLAVISDPVGAVLCVWEPGDRKGAQVVNEPRAWSMSLLQTPDPEVAKAFYGEVFGWQGEPFGPGVTLWRLPGYFGGEPNQPVPRDVVAGMMKSTDVAPHWRVDFWVEDTDATAATAGRLGGQVIAEPFDTPGFRSAVLADPHGAAFSINQLIVPH
jgi:predicted enzyme related to lactoylglutathione lyase